MIIDTRRLQILHFSFQRFSFSLIEFYGVFLLIPDHFYFRLARHGWAGLPRPSVVNLDLPWSTDPTEAREELGYFLWVFGRQFWSFSAAAVFRLRVYFLAFKVCSWNFCISFLFFSTFVSFGISFFYFKTLLFGFVRIMLAALFRSALPSLLLFPS